MPVDKLLHLLVGALIVALLWPAIGPFALLPCLAIAVLKEVYDGFHPEAHTSDSLDAVSTVVGGVLAIAASVLIASLAGWLA